MSSPSRSKSLPYPGTDTPEYERWRRGHGVIRHTEATCAQVQLLASHLVRLELQPDMVSVYRLLTALDRLTSAAQWLVVHMGYARRIRETGEPLQRADFKPHPEDHHLVGALDLVPAYAAYLTLNRLTGTTRSWVLGAGHWGAAIEAVNALTDNLYPEQQACYQGPQGWSRLVADFSSRQDSRGRAGVPLGTHVSAHTAGAILEGSYPGDAELQSVHMPLPGESLVTFVSAEDMEAQPAFQQVPRWWRQQDCGLVMPVMIAEACRLAPHIHLGNREGLERFERHLSQLGFDPIRFDGRDPAVCVCAIYGMERSLKERGEQAEQRRLRYPVRMPFGIAETGAGALPDLPLPGNPHIDARAREQFQRLTALLWVAPEELAGALKILAQAQTPTQPAEKDHPLARRSPDTPVMPDLPYCHAPMASPLAAVDHFFRALTEANPGLRPRLANPGDFAGPRLPQSVAALKCREANPHSPREDLRGAVITTGNTEAAVAACLANKAGLNLITDQESACIRMFGLLQEELRFARQQKTAGRPPRWLGLPVVASAHTWESGSKGHACQDTSFCEAMLAASGDVARVLFPADYNSTLAALPRVYQDRGRISCLVVPEHERPSVFDAAEAEALARQGALVVDEDLSSSNEPLLLVASGAYQLSEAIRACERLRDAGTSFRLVYLQEPGRFRQPRDNREASFCASELERERLFPHRMGHRVAVTHMRPETFRGHLHPLFSDPFHHRVLGYRNCSGPLSEAGTLFANQCSWGHILLACARVLRMTPENWLSGPELEAVTGQGDPAAIIRGLPCR